jgi:hypothetical protein
MFQEFIKINKIATLIFISSLLFSNKGLNVLIKNKSCSVQTKESSQINDGENKNESLDCNKKPSMKYEQHKNQELFVAINHLELQIF